MSSMPSSTSRVLIVDDDKISREALADLLEAEGYQLYFAENGAQAVMMARRAHPDLILLDVMMPEMTGYEVCQLLRRDPALAEVPIILVTALDDRASRIQGLEAGADDFISKPYERLELRMRVRTILKLNRFRGLVAERNKFAWVLAQSREGYLLLDSAGRITYANPRACQYLHMEKAFKGADFLAQAKRHYQCLPEEAWAGWPCTPPDGQAYLVRPEGKGEQAVWLETDTCLPRQHGGDEILIRLHDTSTELNTLRQVWTFHGLVSHKLRTPLTGLKAIQLIKMQLGAQLDPALTQLVDMANQSAERLERHLMDVLNYIHAPYLLNPHSKGIKVGELPEIIADVASELEVNTRLYIPSLFAELALPLGPEALKSVFQAVLDNARKFHPEHTPQVDISATREADSGMLSLCIQDDGRHLSQEALTRIWQPYYQDESVFTGEIPGTGLGLAGVALVIWGAGGRCRARNRVDKTGMVVEFTLPTH